MLDITNYYEQLVIDQLWHIIEEHRVSDELINQMFIEDIACLALNKLPACYVRNRADKCAHLSEIKCDEMRQEVSQAIAEAMEQVKRRPRVDRDE
jgi:hypothetical protein